MTGKNLKGKDSHICLAGIDKLELQAIQEFLVKKEVNLEEEEIEKIEGERDRKRDREKKRERQRDRARERERANKRKNKRETE